MLRSAQVRLCLLVISWGFLLIESVAAPPGNICVCKRTDADRLHVNCSGHSGPLRVEDIATCTLRPAENENSTSSEVFAMADFDVEDVVAVYTVGSNLQELDFRIFNNFTNLHTLNVSQSSITNVTWENCSLPALKYLDLSYNNFTHLDRSFFTCNRSLSVLGMYGKSKPAGRGVKCWEGKIHIIVTTITPDHIILCHQDVRTMKLIFEDNNAKGTPWDCSLLNWFVEWIRKPDMQGLVIPKKPYILCYYYSMPRPRSANMAEVIESCPKNCSCSIMRFDLMEVECSGRGYYDFPEYIPYNTRCIRMENNAIRSFQRILNLTNYQNITMLYLGNNAIESLKELEGIQRYLRLSTLDLAGNRITDLPVHIMEQIEADSIKLGGNPWHCSCEKGTSLRKYITDSHHRKIQDISNITCASTEGKLANKAVHLLTTSDMCYSERNTIHPLDIVNGILAFLIVIVLVKLVYDWWQFKHSGKLPVGPTYLAQMWKQRGARLNRAKLDCTKSLLTQKEPSSPNV